MGSQLEPETVLKVFYQACQAVKHLHSQSMPITHRDIKVDIVCYPAARNYNLIELVD